MKILRAFILADTVLLAALGLGMAFIHPGSFPEVYLEVEVSRSAASLGFVAAGLGALALVLWMSTELPLVGDRRRLALGLSFANLLIAVVAFLQADLWGRTLGWSLVAVFLGLATGLAWTGLRPRKPEEIAAEIEGLTIPDEIRQGLLRQIEEAAAQEERNRLARDLHDSIKQQLFSINVGTAAAQERWDRDPEGARKALADVRRSAREAMVEMQAMLHQLRPEALGTAGLIEALREQCEALGYRSGAEVTLELGEPVPDDRLPPGAPETLFRIAQEMLANVARHARARQVRLWLGRQDEEVVIQIEDDGQGFDPEAEVSGMGLRNLKERAESLAGRLEIASAPGSGTRMAARVPLTAALSCENPLAREIQRETQALYSMLIMIPMFTNTTLFGQELEGFFRAAALTFFLFKAIESGVRIHKTLNQWPNARSSDISRLRYLGRRNRAMLFLAEAWGFLSLSRIADGGWSVLWMLSAFFFLGLTGFEAFSAFRREEEQRTGGLLGALVPSTLVPGLPLVILWIAEKLGPGSARLELFFLEGAVLVYFQWRRPRAPGVPS